MKIKYFGHSCFMLEVMNKKLLFDPFISPNPLASHIDINSLMPDLILVSHGHEDHIYDVEQIAKNSNAQVIAVYEVATWFSKKGVENTIGLNTGGEITWENIKIKAMYAQHSSQMPDGAYGGNPIGSLIRTEEGNLYSC